MPTHPQKIARLRCLSFLIDEALRLADEGDLPTIAAKLFEANDRVAVELDRLNDTETQAAPARVMFEDKLDEE